MANTAVATGSVLNVMKAAEKVITHYAARNNPYSAFMGAGPGKIIQTKQDLKKSKGDKMRQYLFAKLSGEGVTGDNTQEGNEVSMSPYSMDGLIDMIRHGVRLDGEMTEQRSEVELRPEAIEALSIWAKDFITEVITYYLAGARGNRTGMLHSTAYAGHASNAFAAPDAAHRLIAGAGTEALLTGGDKMSVQLLDRARRQIRLLMNSGTPFRAPETGGDMRIVGVAFMPPEHVYDLEQDPTFVSAQKDAQKRGADNPLFQAADYYWRGILIKEVDCGVTLTNGAGGANFGRTVIGGAQALSFFQGGTKGKDGETGFFKFVEKDDFDYHNQWGLVVKAILGMIKNRFNGSDLGTFAVDAAYSA